MNGPMIPRGAVLVLLAGLTLVSWACDELVVEVAPVAMVTIEPSQPSLYKGSELRLEATVQDSEGRPLRQRPIEWSVDDPTVASMAADGTLRALAVGETTIRAHSEGMTGSVIVTVPNREPEVDVTAPDEGASYIERDSVTFAATATDPDDGPLGAESVVWTSNLDGEIGTDTIFTTTALSVGQHTIVGTATDAHGASARDSMTVIVVANQPPEVTIERPADGSAFLVGNTITFSGSATDDVDGAMPAESLVWTSDRDGQLATGEELVTSDLSTGEHLIRLSVRDSHGATGTDSIVVVVHQAPTATITSPAEGSIHTAGEAIRFSGSATDPEDGRLTGGSLVWESDQDGALGTGEELSRSDLSPGRHLIQLQATDSRGVRVTVSVTITINQPPMVAIMRPADGSTLVQGERIALLGSAEDLEDGALSGASLRWTSSVHGGIGTGTLIWSPSLSVGEHVFRLVATDSHGVRASDSVVINVIAGTLGIGLSDHQFVRIEGGRFRMGDITGNGWSRELPVHTVNITKDFYLQRTEVTHAQWQAVMGYNPSFFANCGDTCPVESVSWNEVQEFIRRLNEANPGKNYRLPTEAEWEYAARAGSTGDYAGTGVLDDMGWHTRSGSTHPVARKLPNQWGLYDMHGNVWEWVQDWYDIDYYNSSPTNDPQGPNSGTERGLRGGSWYDPAFYSRSAFRAYRIPSYQDVKYGFRLARSP